VFDVLTRKPARHVVERFWNRWDVFRKANGYTCCQIIICRGALWLGNAPVCVGLDSAYQILIPRSLIGRPK